MKEKEKESSAEGRNAKDKEKERAHAEMTQRLEEYETLSTKSMNELSDKEKIIQDSEKEKIFQEQENLIKEKEKAAEIFEEKEQSHAEMATT